MDDILIAWGSFLKEHDDKCHNNKLISEIQRKEAQALSRSNSDYLNHGYRVSYETENGTIQFMGIKDGEMIYIMTPYGNGPPRIPGMNANWRNKMVSGRWDTSPSTPGSGAPYMQRVKFLSWDDVMALELPARDKALMLIGPSQRSPDRDPMFSEVQFYCSCPSFKFHYQYVANQNNASIEPEGRPPNITNPDRRGVFCKHLHYINEVYPFSWMQVAQHIANGGYAYQGEIFAHLPGT